MLLAFVFGPLLQLAAGCQDGLLYLLDLGRVFPPENPVLMPHLGVPQIAVFRLQHRPELLHAVRQNPELCPGGPFSSDSYTQWGNINEGHDAGANQLSKLVMRRLVDLAGELDKEYEADTFSMSWFMAPWLEECPKLRPAIQLIMEDGEWLQKSKEPNFDGAQAHTNTCT